MAYAEDDPRLKFVPLVEATKPPPDLIRHLENFWWIVHPTKGVVYFIGAGKHMSPQANRSQEICTRFLADYPWAQVLHIPSVFHRINPQDYT
jgi:hypothetical protein